MVGVKVCEQCGKEYEPNKFTAKRQKFCSPECNRVWYYENPKGESCTCLNCGKEYIPKSKERNQYCSRECAFENIAKWGRLLQGKEEKTCPVCKKAYYLQDAYCSTECKQKDNPIICEICGKEFTGNLSRQYCPTCKSNGTNEKLRYEKYKNSEQYKVDLAKQREAYKPNKTYKKKCQQCGIEFYTTRSSQVNCSSKCSRLAIKQSESYKQDRKRQRHARRARMNGATLEKFNDIEIFERDKWVCKICGKKVNRNIKYPHSLSPSLDHIIPLSKGGSHTKDNVQLAHFICNSIKSDNDTIPTKHGQLMFV